MHGEVGGAGGAGKERTEACQREIKRETKKEATLAAHTHTCTQSTQAQVEAARWPQLYRRAGVQYKNVAI